MKGDAPTDDDEQAYQSLLKFENSLKTLSLEANFLRWYEEVKGMMQVNEVSCSFCQKSYSSP